jgi:hypothetical protein
LTLRAGEKMVQIEACVANEILRKFKDELAESVFSKFQNIDLPMPNNGPLYRIHLAILASSKGSIEELNHAIDLAIIDWRDVLVNANYENSDWKQAAIKDGIVFIDDDKLFPIGSLRNYKHDLNEYIITYLSGDESQSGYNPINQEKRIKEKYKKEWQSIYAIVVSFINSIDFIYPNWEKENYEQFGNRIKEELTNRYPFLSIEASNQIANSILYGYK